MVRRTVLTRVRTGDGDGDRFAIRPAERRLLEDQRLVQLEMRGQDTGLQRLRLVDLRDAASGPPDPLVQILQLTGRLRTVSYGGVGQTALSQDHHHRAPICKRGLE